MASKRRQFTYTDYTMGWICALPNEQTAARAMLSEIHPSLPNKENDLNYYTFGSVAGHNVAITCLPGGDYGLVPASQAAAHMTGSFPNIKVGLMVGIGGGIPSTKVQLGDVVVSEPIGGYPAVVQYNRSGTNPDGFERTGSLNRPPIALLTAVKSLKSDHDLNGSRISEFIGEAEEVHPRLRRSGYTGSESLEDPLYSARREIQGKWKGMVLVICAVFMDTFWYILGVKSCAPAAKPVNRGKVPVSRGSKRASGEVHIHYGLVASANTVMKDAVARDKLNDRFNGRVLCLETEAAGLMNHFPCIVVRGICDYADSGKDKTWQNYAAMVAAAYTKELLHHIQPGHIGIAAPVQGTTQNGLEAPGTIHIDI
ncbi:ankyrin repeat-containing protein [Penicillium verhagenii]|uniref:ankyrin repeat-containing protein n=1 Tax=Penicillium verhagenii TaxID=1562060 RepID=UPI00254521EC|nr:ankyrin repeat-containing protein [Penicillium verhagenii]KAJ5936681.1 ankyrin repeat-containing protein [Penicillium verhagenii]